MVDQPIFAARGVASTSFSQAAGALALIPPTVPSTTRRSIPDPSCARRRIGRDASRTPRPLSPAPAPCVRIRAEPERF